MEALEYRYYKVGQTSSGAPRIWMQGAGLITANFTKGKPYSVTLNPTDRTIILKIIDTDKACDVVRNVSGRKNKRTEKVTPIVELANQEIVEITRLATRVRCDFYENEIHISIHHLDLKIEARESRLAANIANGCITKAVVCVGIGVSSAAGYDGLHSSGMNCITKFVVDRERRYLDVLKTNNHSISKSTKIFESTLEELETDLIDHVDCVSFSLACTGMGASGKAKNKIKLAEEHPTDATGVFGLVRLIEKSQPSILVSENVVAAKNSATYILLKSLLKIYGYNIVEKVLNTSHTKSVENRERYWFVATSSGLPLPDLNNFPIYEREYEDLDALLDVVPYASKMWKSTEEKKRKAALNKANNKGFGFNLVTPNVININTIGKGYQKDRATECHIAGPNNLMRLLTPQELSKAQSVPLHLTKNLSANIAYEGLGQGVDYRQSEGIFKCLARDVLLPLKKRAQEYVAEYKIKELDYKHVYF